MGTDIVISMSERGFLDTGKPVVHVRHVVLLHSATRRLYEIESVNRRNRTVSGPRIEQPLPAKEFEPTLLKRLP